MDNLRNRCLREHVARTPMSQVDPEAVGAVADFIAHRLRVRGSSDGLDGSRAWMAGIVHDLIHGSAPGAAACRRRLERAGVTVVGDPAALVRVVETANAIALAESTRREQTRRDEARARRERQLRR